MAGKPLRLNWSEIMPEEEGVAAPPDLEVVSTAQLGGASASGLDASSSSMVHGLTNAQLEEKIQRLKKHLGSEIQRNLPDKGQKLEANLRLIHEELDRRRLARIRKGDEKCETAAQSKATESCVTSSNSIQAITTSKCNFQPSFFSHFAQKFDKRADSVSKGKSLNKSQRKMHEKMHMHFISSQSTRLSSRQASFPSASTPASIEQRRSSSKDSNIIETSNFYAPCAERRSSKRLSSRQAPFPSASTLASIEQRRSSSKDCNNIETSNFYASCAERRSSKGLKISEGRDTMILRSEKVHDVVFLDEEDAQTKQPTRDAFDDRKEPKMYYPSRDGRESVELSYSDLKCLEPGQYLSSHIMNFYILYLQRPLFPISNPKGEYYFFNTYFYGKLEEALSSKGDRSLRFSKLRRWWRGVNIFEKAYIFLPIHRDLHWSLVIISIPPKEDESRPIILHLDSLGLHNSKIILEVIHGYLTEEWKFMKQSATSTNVPISEKIWIDLSRKIDKKEIKVPQQKNVYDCGLFVLYFMERFIEEAPERLKREDLVMFDRKWFQPEDASSLRKRIKDLLLEEFESSSLEHGRQGCQESPSTSETDE